MQKANLYFGIGGLIVGLVAGYFGTQAINKNGPAAPPAAQVQGQAPQQPAGGPPAQVMEMVTKAKNEPENFDAQVQAAELYFQIRRLDQSVEFLQRALKLKPNNEMVLFNLTNVLLEKGDKAEAQKTFQQLEKIKASTPELKQQREDLRKKIATS